MKEKGFEDRFFDTVGKELMDDLRDGVNRFKMVLESKLREYVHGKVKIKDMSDDHMAEKILMTVKRIRERTEDKSLLPDGDIFIYEDKSEKPVIQNASMMEDGTLAFSKSFMSRFTYDELAFVVGHEMAHYKLKHNKTIPKVYNLVENLGEHLGYMRYMEHEADMLGTYYGMQAGGTFTSAVSAIRKLSNMEDKVTMSFEYFSTHPTAAERVYYLRQNYSHDAVKRIVQDRLFERVRHVSNAKSFTGLEVRAELIKRISIPRKDKEKVLEVCLQDMQEYMKKNPSKAELQTFLDTKAAAEKIAMNKKNPYASNFMKDELELADGLVRKVMALPEMKKFKGMGVVRGAMQVRTQDNSNRKGR